LIALGVLLVSEYLLISLLFDARALHGRAGLSGALGYLGDAATIALVVAAATLTLMGPELKTALATLPRYALARRTLWLGALAHAAAYGALLATTRAVFSTSGGDDPGLGWIAAWGLSALAVAATWLPLALPWPALRALAPRVATALLLGTGAGVLAWFAGAASASAWSLLAPVTLSTVAWLLRLWVEPVLVDPSLSLIGTQYFEVIVAPVCSGFEGIGLIVTFLGGYMVLERKSLRFPRVLVLLPVAVITVWCANALRIALLILVGSYVSPAVAIGGFHSKAGWLFFCVVALGFVALARRSRFFAAEGQLRDRSDEDVNVAAPYLMPLLTLLAAGLIAGLFTVDFDRLYPARIACVLVVLWFYRVHYRGLEWGLHWDSIAIGVAVFALWYQLAAGGDPEDVQTLENGLAGLGAGGSALWIVARIVGMSVVIPIAEELAFRGYVLRRLVSADFDRVDARRPVAWAWLVSSAAFGVLHSDWFAGILAGLAYALAQQRRGRVTDAIVAHGVTNLLLGLDAWLLGNLRWWA
jgi:exosortase E/protease (VPEID-CTERM system)